MDTPPPQAGLHTRRVTAPYHRRGRRGGGIALGEEMARFAAATTRQRGG
jgi:hypothetical protein